MARHIRVAAGIHGHAATGVGEPTRVVARLPATVDADVAVGEEQQFVVPARRIRYFEAQSGTRTDGVVK